ncbi:hypothetical protein ACFYO1_14845 [Nocardia sp. NPDC006044]|uniref:hypothetical protein n=1 Tax=Nocardia sp. NPDC006044 TaxID=3364306 RepID=UPI0036C11087
MDKLIRAGRMVSVGSQAEDYSTAEIVVRPFEEAVRARPHMFFGCHRENPRLAGAVVNAVVRDTLGEPDRHPATAEVVTESDHRFTITDNIVNEMGKLDANGLPLSRWALGALLAVSARTWIEIRTADRQWSREFAGPRPSSRLANRTRRAAQALESRANSIATTFPLRQYCPPLRIFWTHGTTG